MLHGAGVFGLTCKPLRGRHPITSVTFCPRPTGGIAGVLLFFFLNLNPHQGRTFREHIAEFDFVGLILIVAGVICLLVGFNNSETSCACMRCILTEFHC